MQNNLISNNRHSFFARTKQKYYTALRNLNLNPIVIDSGQIIRKWKVDGVVSHCPYCITNFTSNPTLEPIKPNAVVLKDRLFLLRWSNLCLVIIIITLYRRERRKVRNYKFSLRKIKKRRNSNPIYMTQSDTQRRLTFVYVVIHICFERYRSNQSIWLTSLYWSFCNLWN